MRHQQHVSFRLPPEVLATLDALARHYSPGTSRAAALRMAITHEARRELGDLAPPDGPPHRKPGRPKSANRS